MVVGGSITVELLKHAKPFLLFANEFENFSLPWNVAAAVVVVFVVVVVVTVVVIIIIFVVAVVVVVAAVDVLAQKKSSDNDLFSWKVTEQVFLPPSAALRLSTKRQTDG